MSAQTSQRITAAQLRAGDKVQVGPAFLSVERVERVPRDADWLCVMLVDAHDKRVRLYYGRTDTLEVRRHAG